jgi:hypothetical protein
MSTSRLVGAVLSVLALWGVAVVQVAAAAPRGALRQLAGQVHAVKTRSQARTSAAQVSPPVPGGVYKGSATYRGARCRACLTLTVADDAGEFAAPSAVELAWPESRRYDVCAPWASLSDLGDFGPPVSARILPTGHFSASIDVAGVRIDVSGRFADRGRRVEGTIKTSPGRRAVRRCRVTGSFRGALHDRSGASTPGRWLACDPVQRRNRLGFIKRFIEVNDRDLGCTPARAAARALHVRVTLGQQLCEPQGCTLGGLPCAQVARGERDPAAQVRCTRPDRAGAVAELTSARVCPYGDPQGEYVPTPSAMNMPCREAAAVTAQWEESDCALTRQGETCHLPAHDCVLLASEDPDIELLRCSRRTDAHAVVEIEQPVTL